MTKDMSLADWVRALPHRTLLQQVVVWLPTCKYGVVCLDQSADVQRLQGGEGRFGNSGGVADGPPVGASPGELRLWKKQHGEG